MSMPQGGAAAPPCKTDMNTFKGFTDSETFTQLPNTFFHQLVHQIEDIAELKVTLFVMWHVDHMDGPFRALRKMDFDVKELGLPAEEIARGLEKAVKRGSLLRVQKDQAVYFLLNSPRGRAAVQAIEKWVKKPNAKLPACTDDSTQEATG